MEAVYLDKNAKLVQACHNGNRNAQFELYKLYANAMYNVALRIVNNTDEAEDVLQESFLDAFRRLADFRGETTFGLWLKQIVVNRSINYLRKRKAELVSLDDVEVEDEEQKDEESVVLKVETVRLAMAELAEGYRVVLSLYLFEGYDHEEIAHILKITENTSRTQYMRAKKKLYGILEQKGMAR